MVTVAGPRRLEHHEITRYLPYRSPWLLIDRVLDWTPGERIITQKCVSSADPWIAAHLGDGPRIIPGVLLIELIGQSAHLLGSLSAHHSGQASDPELRVLARCRGQFIMPALAGDILQANVRLEDIVRGASVIEGVVTVDDREVCRAQLIGAPFEGVLSGGEL